MSDESGPSSNGFNYDGHCEAPLCDPTNKLSKPLLAQSASSKLHRVVNALSLGLIFTQIKIIKIKIMILVH